MSFGQDFLQGFFQPNGLKDYSHAAKTFLPNGYEYSPRYKFLFHVYFNINTSQIPGLDKVFNSQEQAIVGVMVKNIQLPSYQMNVETMNQYNRKRLVQTKIEYNPVQIVFNDDQGDLIRNMWYNYYSYYYKDPSQKYQGNPVSDGTAGISQTIANGFGYNTRDIYNGSRQVSDWGYIGESYTDGLSNTTSTSGKPAFFNDITIYGLSQKKYASYTLINPLITEWQHDTYDYSQGNGTMTHTMSIKYETVKYGQGAVGGTTPSTTVPGFADPSYYDTVKSGIARPGATATVFGQGGILDAVSGTFNDLSLLASGQGGAQNAIGAILNASQAYNTLKKNPSVIANAPKEIQTAAQQYIRSIGRGAPIAPSTGRGTIFPVSNVAGSITSAFTTNNLNING